MTTSVIVNQVNINGIAVFEAKDDAPIRGDLDRPVAGPVAFEWVEVKTRQH